jgi:hypothetical protein
VPNVVKLESETVPNVVEVGKQNCAKCYREGGRKVSRRKEKKAIQTAMRKAEKPDNNRDDSMVNGRTEKIEKTVETAKVEKIEKKNDVELGDIKEQKSEKEKGLAGIDVPKESIDYAGGFTEKTEKPEKTPKNEKTEERKERSVAGIKGRAKIVAKSKAKPNVKPKAKKTAKPGIRRTLPVAKPKKKVAGTKKDHDIFKYIEDFLKNGREKDINMVFAEMPIIIKKWMKEDPNYLSIEYKSLLEVVTKNIPSLLANIEIINKNIDPTAMIEGMNKTANVITRELPWFVLKLLAHPGKAVDASLAAIIYTTLYLLEGVQKLMLSMMDDTMKKTMAGQGMGRKLMTSRARY